MKEYYITSIDHDNFDCYLLCLSYDSILNYINNLEEEKCIQSKQGVLLVDQLLVTGNGKNRFVSCSFSHGRLDLVTARNETPETEIRMIASEYLRDHEDILENSILPSYLRERILLGELM